MYCTLHCTGVIQQNQFATRFFWPRGPFLERPDTFSGAKTILGAQYILE